jgi:signal transduction histidine kinase/CheY-like chemotaxis protein
MTTSVDVRLLVGVACILLVLSLCLAAYLRSTWTARFRTAVTLYAASLASLVLSAFGVFLSQTAPFILSTTLLITGAHFGIVLAYLSIHETLRPHRRLRALLGVAALICLGQTLLAALFHQAALLIITSSVVNTAVGVLAGAHLWIVASTTSPRIRLLISAPFFLIGSAYCLRLALLAVTDPADWFVMASSVIAFVLGLASLYVGFALIILREAALADDLRLAREQTEEAMRQRTRFFSQINHELRTPLNGILGLTRMLSAHVQGDAGAKTLRDLQSSASLLKTVVDDVLHFAKLESDAVQLESIAFDLSDVLGSLVTQYHALASENGVTVRHDPLSAPAGWRIGDPMRLTQILHNILANAVKFTAKGEIVISVRQAADDRLAISIVDSGIGMDPDQLRALFVPFQQASASTARQYGGTGLGMSIVRMLVDAMGGQITVDSSPGQGTRVDLTLPMERAAPPLSKNNQDTASAQVPPPAPPLNATPGGLHVLCADDDEINRLVLQAFLAEIGFAPVMAGSGAEAITLARENAFDVYLIDINMPGMGGVETLAALRMTETEGRDAPRHGLPPLAVAVTANVMEADVKAYIAAGFDAHLPKPIVFEDLTAMLARAQDRQQTAPHSAARSR